MSIEKVEKQEQNLLEKSATHQIAYVLGRFPVLSETFIYQEILELEDQGGQARIFTLFRPEKTQKIVPSWEGHAAITCIADTPLLILILTFFSGFLRNPLRFLKTSFTMLNHSHLRFLINCRVLLSAAFLARQFEKENILHMHAHFASEATSVAQCTYLLTGVPYSFTSHAVDIFIASKESLAFKMHMAHFMITVSTYNLDYLKSLVNEEISQRIHLIQCGIRFSLFPSITRPVSQATQAQVVISVGRLVEKKGFHYLIHACRLLANQNYQFTCYIVGDGPLRQQLARTIDELGLSDKVLLIGAQPHAQVIKMYQNATIMALPCIISKDGDRDALPNVIMEALYCGIPAVSTTAAGISELITTEKDGLLVPPNDSAALALALARLLDDSSLRSRLAQAGQQMVRERFDLTRNVQRLLHLIYGDRNS